MLILGIHDGHNASACLMKEGKVLYALQEERMTGAKNSEGFPKNAVEHILHEYNLTGKDIDEVAIATKSRTPEKSKRAGAIFKA